MDYEQKLRRLILTALDHKASDIHITAHGSKITLELRTLSKLVKLDKPQITAAFIDYLRYKAKLDLFSVFKPQTGRIELVLAETTYFIRLAYVKNNQLETLVLRILNPPQILTVETLFNREDELVKITQMLFRASGLVLFSGSTGSGKSTTLFTCLRLLKELKIYSIEDPIETYHEFMVQMEVNPRQNFGFAEAIKQVLRHDPNVIVIGEIRDPSEAKAALRCALSGHLVLSTIHANTAHQTKARLLEFGLEPGFLDQVLLGVVYQELIYDPKIQSRSAVFDIVSNLEEQSRIRASL